MISKYTTKLVEIIHKHLPGCKIYLFKLNPTNTKQEIFEAYIALDAGKISDLGILGNIYSDLKKELLPVDFDLIDINNTSQELKDKIIKKGLLLHKGNL
ncbi:hypothetical protein GF322_03300 [Candidatus Dependentiae bacterium]|nr:hypothetical protein [Candidatus Dependentiae bacterium]